MITLSPCAVSKRKKFNNVGVAVDLKVNHGIDSINRDSADYLIRNLSPQENCTGFISQKYPRHKRLVYIDWKSKVVYKIWDNQYVDSQALLDSVKSGFVQSICPAFLGLILDNNGMCNGYYMHKCSANFPPPMMGKTLNMLMFATKMSKFYFRDAQRVNMMTYQNHPCIIDLECCDSLNNFKTSKNTAYDKYIKDLIDG